MTRGNPSLSLPDSLAGLVKAPSEFDSALGNNHFPVFDIQACATIPLSRFVMDINQQNQEQTAWFQQVPISLQPTKKLFRTYFTASHDVDPVEWIRHNRDYFGWSAGIKDIIWTTHPGKAEKILSSKGVGSILRLGEAVLDATEEQRTLQRVVGASYLREFLSFNETSTVIQESMRRQGVQLVYGGEGFENFVRTHSLAAGDILFGRKTNNCRIPTGFLRAVIPVGPYEQEQLLGHSAGTLKD